MVQIEASPGEDHFAVTDRTGDQTPQDDNRHDLEGQ